jgi:hypothetical protein
MLRPKGNPSTSSLKYEPEDPGGGPTGTRLDVDLDRKRGSSFLSTDRDSYDVPI